MVNLRRFGRPDLETKMESHSPCFVPEKLNGISSLPKGERAWVHKKSKQRGRSQKNRKSKKFKEFIMTTGLGLDIAKQKVDPALLLENGKYKSKVFANTHPQGLHCTPAMAGHSGDSKNPGLHGSHGSLPRGCRHLPL